MQPIFINSGVLRRIYPLDTHAFRDHLLRLDSEGRHDRFAAAVSDAYIEDYVIGFFRSGDIAYGYFVGEELRGAGELRQVGDGTAEAAFSVEPQWRRTGVGTALMSRIVRAARNRNDKILMMMCLSQNRAMQQLAKHFSADLTFATDQVTGRMVGRMATPISLWSEALDDTLGLVGTMLHPRAGIAPVI